MNDKASPPSPGMTGTRRQSTIGLLLGMLDRPSQVRVVLAALLSGGLALLETVAIVTVLPLVGIATGAPLDEGAVGAVWRMLGEPGRTRFGLLLLLVVVGIFVAKDIFAMAFAWWQGGFVTSRRVGMSAEIFRRLMAEPFVEHRTRNLGESLRTMNAAVGQVFSTLSAFLTILSSGLTVTAILAALLMTTPLQALLATVYFSLAALAYLKFVRPRITAVGEDIMRGSKEATIAGLQGLQGFKEVKLRQSAGFFQRRFEDGLARNEYAARSGNFLSSITRYLLEILFILAVGGLLMHSFLTGTATSAVGSLALFVAAGFRLLPNISGLVGAVNSVRMGRAAVELVSAELDRPERVAAHASGDELRDVLYERDLVLESVRFRYPGAAADVLRGIDLRIPRGSSMAFVGTSGAGKTTLVDVILGLLVPGEGRLLVDGEDISGHLISWQRQCAMVAQEVFIAEDTVRKNILFDMDPETADEAALDDAVTKSQLVDVVEAMPGGLDADVGDWGSRLSGGQRQRLGIARALYKRPALLVLDEATSALDNETERRITETIHALHGETTVLVVAHRLSTVRNVDTVVFLENGLVSDSGSFEELRRRSPGFRHLVELGDLGRDRTERDAQQDS